MGKHTSRIVWGHIDLSESCITRDINTGEDEVKNALKFFCNKGFFQVRAL